MGVCRCLCAVPEADADAVVLGGLRIYEWTFLCGEESISLAFLRGFMDKGRERRAKFLVSGRCFFVHLVLVRRVVRLVLEILWFTQ